jgi:hypothetical protein
MSAVVISINIKTYIIFKISTAAKPASHLEGSDGHSTNHPDGKMLCSSDCNNTIAISTFDGYNYI